MKSNRLLVLGLILMFTGMIGISAVPWFGNIPTFANWSMYQGGMMGSDMPGRGPMMEMMREMRSGRLPPGVTPAELPDPDSPGAKLTARYCTQCHNLPSPAMHAAEEWPRVEALMFNRMKMMSSMRGMMAGMMRHHKMHIESPTNDEKESILSYLQRHALTPVNPEKLGAPGTPGLSLFRKTCSQCHALPDPALHRAEQWSAIVERMRSNMQIMGKFVIQDDEKEQIVSYLKAHAS